MDTGGKNKRDASEDSVHVHREKFIAKGDSLPSRQGGLLKINESGVSLRLRRKAEDSLPMGVRLTNQYFL